MANQEHLEILKHGVEAWNEWRAEHEKVEVDLRMANLPGAHLRGAYLPGAHLQKANLPGADLSGANLRAVHLSGANLNEADLREADLQWAHFDRARLDRANFREAHFQQANFMEANLRTANLCEADLHGVCFLRANLSAANLCGTDLRGADLRGANLDGADLRKANLCGANLNAAHLSGTDLRETDFNEVRLGNTIFAFTNLSTSKGLDTCVYTGPSSLDVHTLMHSKNLPEVFLRGCGLPDNLITYMPSLFQVSAIQFYSCFISYSTKDHLFADRLFNDLQGKGVRTWYAPEELKGGEKLYDQIDSAIRLYDKLLLVLSDHSLKSKWVLTEIRRCRKSEEREGKRKLFPIRLVNIETIQDWECFDADSGKDLAVEVREFFIPDFSHWKDHDSYQKAFDRLLRDLQESAEQEISSA